MKEHSKDDKVLESATEARQESKPRGSVQVVPCSPTKTENVQSGEKPNDDIRARLERLNRRSENSERRTSEKVETGGGLQKDRSVVVTGEIALDLIEIAAGTESRLIRHEVVEEYAELIKAGTIFPPIDLYEQGGKYHLADGFHRTTAARSAGLRTIQARIFLGGRLEALKAALGANETHGLRRSVEDKRYAVDKALKEFADRSNRIIAEMCHVSPTFVGERRDLQTTVNVDSSSDDEQPKRIGRDGKARRQPTRLTAANDDGKPTDASTVDGPVGSTTAIPEDVTGPANENEANRETTHPKRGDDVEENALAEAKQALSKLAGKLDVRGQKVFWHTIVAFAQEQIVAFVTEQPDVRKKSSRGD